MTRTTGPRRAVALVAAALAVGGGAAAAEPPTPSAMAPSAMAPAAPAAGSASLSAELRAQVTPRQYTTLAAGMAGRIEKLSVRPGDRFDKGERLVTFECSEERARLAKATAALERARRKAGVQEKLADLGSTSGIKVAVARARVDEAEAERGVRRARVNKCTIHAPFAGRVAKRHVRPGEAAKEGGKLLKIVNTDDLWVELIVPSKWLRWLERGRRFKVRIHETGNTYPVKVARLAPWIDAVSQSVKVFATVEAGADDLLPGMSGRALLSPPGDSARPNG